MFHEIQHDLVSLVNRDRILYTYEIFYAHIIFNAKYAPKCVKDSFRVNKNDFSRFLNMSRAFASKYLLYLFSLGFSLNIGVDLDEY